MKQHEIEALKSRIDVLEMSVIQRDRDKRELEMKLQESRQAFRELIDAMLDKLAGT